MERKHILVLRISAMGDVAMTVPVLQQLLQQHPFIHLTVVTDGYFSPLFEGLDRTTVFPFQRHGKHKGMSGLFRFYRQLKRNARYDAVADLHNVVRSKILRKSFRVQGIPVAVIDKGRHEKKQLTRKKHKKLVQLKTTFQRYADVFEKLGLPVHLNLTERVFKRQLLPVAALHLVDTHKRHVGIAPFAKHKEKVYPPEKMKKVIRELMKERGFQVFLFGNETNEARELALWEKELPGAINLAGKFNFREQLALVSNMDLVLSMDSANMHLASLFGIPVVSIWGATHPYFGFYGWGQPENNVVQIDLYCRPCSKFGNKPCYRGDHACMERIKVEAVLEQVDLLLR